MTKDFFDELCDMDLADLELIYRDQRELYSDEEAALIEDIYHRRKDAEAEEYNNRQFALTMFCLMALLSPFAGVLGGIIMLVHCRNNEKWKNAGWRTLLAAFISLLILVFLNAGGFKI